ncbi:MAG: hypothetical protein EA403_10135 [Spirochaetaceae bacterium]|nr:MAG: hypothetical protein EA403_10135 [Spirochaetaceae bacterium]
MTALTIGIPVGIERVLLIVFGLAGVLGFFSVAQEGHSGRTVAAAVHSAGAVLALLSRDLVTLLVSWELLTFAAFFVIRTAPSQAPLPGRVYVGASRSADAAFWYVGAQIVGAVFFFVAIVIQSASTGSIAIGSMVPPAQPWITAAILIKTAMIPLHGWLVSSYTAATPASSVLLSAFTTKVGVLTAARLVEWTVVGFPLLSWIGGIVAVVAVACALVQASARRLLSFHIVSQVGYMLVGVGLVGFHELGVTAGLFHAGNHIIYKALLFAVAALVIHRLGHDSLGRMGGLARRMPFTFICCIIGAGAIAGVPFLSGYGSKELLKVAAGYSVPMRLLNLATVGTGLSFIKFTYLIFLAPDENPPAVSPSPVAVGTSQAGGRPTALLAAAAVLALLSVLFGIFPGWVSGVRGHEYFSPAALWAGTQPLLLSVLLWVLFRNRLIAAVRRHRGERRMFRDALLRAAPPLFRVVLRAHAVDVQLALGAVLTVVILLFVVW